MGTLKFRHLALATLASLLLASVAVAAPLANVSVNAASLNLDPIVSVNAMKLVVSGPGDFRYEEVFGSAAPISLPLSVNLADGVYVYELTSIAPARSRKGEPGKADRTVTTFQQAGAFTIKNGLGVSASLEEAPTKDIVHLDDTIITFSLCVGNDCVNGENFGFDTVRLKENNLRIHFDDTSVSASFPRNDWRIVINDTGNGGANYFGVEDSTAGRIPFRVEAGAPVNTLYAEADGDVGIKTANPVVDLHIVEGNTPTVRLEQDGSDGFTPQTYDIAANEANFFIRDVTNGSKLFFRSKPSAPEDSIFIAASGDVGLGTDAPGANLHVRQGGSAVSGNASTIGLFQNNAATGDGAVVAIVSGETANAQLVFGDSADITSGRIIYDNSDDSMRFRTVDTERMFIDSSGNLCLGCTSTAGFDFRIDFDNTGTTTSSINAGDAMFTITSSRSLKENFTPMGSADILEKISDVDVFTYDYIGGPKDRLGLIAEDFHQVFERGSDRSISGQEVQMALWLAVQELTAQNKALAERLEELEAAKAE